MIHTTQCFLIRNGCFLMMLRNKKKNDINEGKWIAPGGKTEPGETYEQCAVRETLEETGFHVISPEYRGTVYFRHEGITDETIHVYSSERFDGVQTESREGTLRWIPAEDILSLNLWEGDRIFLKYLTEGNRNIFALTLTYDQNGRLTDVQEGVNENE